MPRGNNDRGHALAMTVYAIFGLVYTIAWFYAYQFLNFPPNIYWFMIATNVGWFTVYIVLVVSWARTLDGTRHGR